MPTIAQIQPRDDEIKRTAEEISQIARQTIDAGADSARALLESKPTPGVKRAEIATRATNDLIAEQTGQGIETAAIVTRAAPWNEIFEAQRNFFAASLAGSRKRNDSYRALLRATVKAMTFPTAR